jgi:hypothetical protein
MSKTLKEWIEKEFTPENQYELFVEAVNGKTENSWLSEMGDIIKEYE